LPSNPTNFDELISRLEVIQVIKRGIAFILASTATLTSTVKTSYSGRLNDARGTWQQLKLLHQGCISLNAKFRDDDDTGNGLEDDVTNGLEA
jgi:hypothetical protein